MATTHVFIVDKNTFKYHLEYLFVGTGSKNNIVDFNDNEDCGVHYAIENSLVGLIADFERIRIGDFAIFYVQGGQNFEGKFYGLFKICSEPFIDHNDENQFLKSDLGKSLTFRAKIEAFHVYSSGITEWEALDEIYGMSSPNQMIWSLIYRKLKGNRGNTMITIYESEKLIGLIRRKNNSMQIDGPYFSFDEQNQTIIAGTNKNYTGRMQSINVLPRIIRKFQRGNQFETHLQAYILKNIEQLNLFDFDNIEWIGNEVSCGVGMQRIDILFSFYKDSIRKLFAIELKTTVASPSNLIQLKRYIDWLNQYYIPNRPSDIIPTIISRKIEDKSSAYYQDLLQKFRTFNSTHPNFLINYIEFEITNHGISFEKIIY